MKSCPKEQAFLLKKPMLEDLIISKTRNKVLNLFLEQPEKIYHVREITRRVEEEINAVRRELAFLEKKGILRKEPRANRLYYGIRRDYPFFIDLLSLWSKMRGLGGSMLKNRAKLGKIKYAMMSGKFARNKERAPEDVDILVIGEVVLLELALLVRAEEARRGREINYTVMTEEEFSFRKKRNDPFVQNILLSSRVMLIGDEDELIR